MSIIDLYTCVNYFMSVLVANIFFPNLIADLGLYIGLACACYIYCVNLCNVLVLIYVCF